MIQKTTLLALLCSLVAMTAKAENNNLPKVGDCTSSFADKMNRPIPVGSEVKSLDQLPKKILVAQAADYLVEAKDLRMWGRQSFMNGESKAVCASFSKNSNLGISMYAPALIDLSEGHQTGNSFWQFHLMIADGKAGVWNQRTMLLSKVVNFLPRLQEAGVQVFMQALSPTNYQLHFVRKSEKGIEHLIIRYDLVDSLQ